ncbi:MAG: 16S rRNA (guanine(966)-N(2))-methyltransferase RsmD [Acidobacteriota bacterium]
MSGSLRIIAGQARGRRLLSVKRDCVRPTASRVREALFSILQSRSSWPGLNQARIMDLFAGSGALGLEALSRGGAHALFVEADRPAARILCENLELCGLRRQAAVLVQTVESFLAAPSPWPPADLVFIDPPWEEAAEEAVARALQPRFLAPNAMVVVEHPVRRQIPPRLGDLARVDERSYGATGLAFFQPIC